MAAGLFPLRVCLRGKVESQTAFAAPLVGSMAFETAIGEKRADIAVKLKGFGGCGPPDREKDKATREQPKKPAKIKARCGWK